jgi:adenosylcobinamide-GDP ribazoletransferase
VPAARPDGLGATVAGSVEPFGLVTALALTAAGCALAGLVSGFDWWAGPLAVVLVVVGAGLLVHRAGRRFGGITGDVLGAAVEVGTAAALLAVAIAT